jgi:hypothetical protein
LGIKTCPPSSDGKLISISHGYCEPCGRVEMDAALGSDDRTVTEIADRERTHGRTFRAYT